jgi:hypothetical protein
MLAHIYLLIGASALLFHSSSPHALQADSVEAPLSWASFAAALSHAGSRQVAQEACDYLSLAARNALADDQQPRGYQTAQALVRAGYVPNKPTYTLTYKAGESAEALAALSRFEERASSNVQARRQGRCSAEVAVLSTNRHARPTRPDDLPPLARAIGAALPRGGIAFVCEQEGYEGVVGSEPSLAAQTAAASAADSSLPPLSRLPATRVSVSARTSLSLRPSATRLEALAVGGGGWAVRDVKTRVTTFNVGVASFGRKSAVHSMLAVAAPGCAAQHWLVSCAHFPTDPGAAHAGALLDDVRDVGADLSLLAGDHNLRLDAALLRAALARSPEAAPSAAADAFSAAFAPASELSAAGARTVRLKHGGAQAGWLDRLQHRTAVGGSVVGAPSSLQHTLSRTLSSLPAPRSTNESAAAHRCFAGRRAPRARPAAARRARRRSHGVGPPQRPGHLRGGRAQWRERGQRRPSLDRANVDRTRSV